MLDDVSDWKKKVSERNQISYATTNKKRAFC